MKMRLSEKISLVSAVLVMAFIFYMSSLSYPPNPFQYVFSWSSLVYHFCIFALLGFFVCYGLKSSKGMIVLGLLICIIYGGLDELHQYFVPGRYSCFSDFFTDSIGIMAGFIGCWVLEKIKKGGLMQ